MEVNLNMDNHNIINLKDPLPSNPQYATTVNFVSKTVSDNNTTISALIDKKIKESEDLDIQGNNEENVFSFVMEKDLFKEDDSDITNVGKVDYFSTRLGIDLTALDLGEYTLVFEMYFNETKIDKN